MDRTTARRHWPGAVIACILCLRGITPAPSTAEDVRACAGDCNGDHSVTVDEILLLTNIALSMQPPSTCMAGDSSGDGVITIDEILAAANNLFGGCATPTPSLTPTPTYTLTRTPSLTATPTSTPTIAIPLFVKGTCQRPGADGLVECADGTQVQVFICDDRAACLQGSQCKQGSSDVETLLGSDMIRHHDGTFTVEVDARRAAGHWLIVQADVDDAVIGCTTSRSVTFGPFAGGRAGAAVMEVTVQLSPILEGAVRLLAKNGFENFTDAGVPEVIAAVQAANANTSFAGDDPNAAANLATQVAELDPAVQIAIDHALLRTRTPTRTPTQTPTYTPTPTHTPTHTPTRRPELVYVTNSNFDTVSVINTSTDRVNSTITISTTNCESNHCGPQSIAFTPGGTRAYVTNSKTGVGDVFGTVSVIDTTTNTVLPTPIHVGTVPLGVAVTPSGEFAYVTNSNSSSNAVSIIDTATNKPVVSVAQCLNSPDGVAIARTTNGDTYAYVANSGSGNSCSPPSVHTGTVSVIDTFSKTVVGVPIPVGDAPHGLAAVRTGNDVLIYVANNGSGTVSVIDTTTNSVRPTPVRIGGMPEGIAVRPGGDRVYVTNSARDSVFVIDTSTNAVIGDPIPVGMVPFGIAITTDGALAYVANKGADTVSVIDLATNQVTGVPIHVDDAPTGVAIKPLAAP